MIFSLKKDNNIHNINEMFLMSDQIIIYFFVRKNGQLSDHILSMYLYLQDIYILLHLLVIVCSFFYYALAGLLLFNNFDGHLLCFLLSVGFLTLGISSFPPSCYGLYLKGICLVSSVRK